MPARVSKTPRPSGRYPFSYTDARGKRVRRVGYTDRRKTQELADKLEHAARLEREGLADPAERTRRAAAAVPVDHLVGLWRDAIVANNATVRHADHQAGAVRRVLAAAGIQALDQFDADAVKAAVARLTTSHPGRPPCPVSARTKNHALAAVKSWCRWLEASGRIKEFPRGFLGREKRANEAADRHHARRALTPEELARLIEATEGGPTWSRWGPTGQCVLDGPRRAALYVLAAGTGFRANECRSLVRESFRLDGETPTVTVLAGYAKNGKTVDQPVGRDVADRVRPFVEAAEPGKPVFPVPEKTAAMLKADLTRAGIPYETAAGVADFHSLRKAYVTALIRGGVAPDVVQALARHSDVRLTLQTYTDTTGGDKRAAVEKAGKFLGGKPPKEEE